MLNIKIRTNRAHTYLFFAAFILLFVPALSASTTWDWNYSSYLYTGSGTFTTQSTTTKQNGYTGYLINSMSGTWNSAIVQLLAPGNLGGNDNLVGTSKHELDGEGFTFKTAADEFNIYYSTGPSTGPLHGPGYEAYGVSGASDGGAAIFSASQIPELSTVALALPSLLLLALLARGPLRQSSVKLKV
jgi:hypothetical protein